jgi:hypothetical protein
VTAAGLSRSAVAAAGHACDHVIFCDFKIVLTVA